MHRQPEHVMMFLLAEMGTSGSLDGQQRLVIKGRFAPKNFEAILRRYISKLSNLIALILVVCFFFFEQMML
jgi:translation initiation factor 2 subunit 2